VRNCANAIEKSVTARPPLLHTHQEGEELDVLVDREIAVERESLGEVSESVVERASVLPGVATEHLYGSRGGAQQTREHPQRRRLPGAIRSDQTDHLTTRYLEIDPAYRLDRPVAHDQPTCGEHDLDGRHRFPPSPVVEK
jgi:hypothetical protein